MFQQTAEEVSILQYSRGQMSAQTLHLPTHPVLPLVHPFPSTQSLGNSYHHAKYPTGLFIGKSNFFLQIIIGQPFFAFFTMKYLETT